MKKKLSKHKYVISTFNEIENFQEDKHLVFSQTEFEWLKNNPVRLYKSDDYFSFEIENRATQLVNKTTEELDFAFSNFQMINKEYSYSCLPYTIQKISSGRKINGTIHSLVKGKKSDFNNKHLRFVQQISKIAKVGCISGAIDLSTDQEIMYGVGIIRLSFSNYSIDVFRISKDKQEFIFIDSVQSILIEKFEKIVKAFFQIYSYIFGVSCGGESYITSSNSSNFIVTDKILFNRKQDEKIHDNYIFDSNEIRKYEFSKSFFQFPCNVFSNMCNRIIIEEKYQRVINIIHEANLNEYSLSTCILFSSALETISSLIAKNEKDSKSPIDVDRFTESEIIDKLEENIEKNKILEKKDKNFLINKRLPNLNKPTNVDKLESPFVKYKISLSDDFKKALKYRDKYLHGSIPKGNKFGTFRANNFNRAYELQFLVNVLTLKYVGYTGFLKNCSAEMEYYTKKEQGKRDKDIVINHPLYYEI